MRRQRLHKPGCHQRRYRNRLCFDTRVMMVMMLVLTGHARLGGVLHRHGNMDAVVNRSEQAGDGIADTQQEAAKQDTQANQRFSCGSDPNST